MSLPALAKETAVTVTAGAITPVTLAADALGYGVARGELVAGQVSTFVREVTVTARALQQVLLAVADAVDDGLLDELRVGLQHVSAAVDLMAVVSTQLDQAMPVLDATTPTLRLMNSTLAQLNGTIAQLEGLPGVRIARRFVGRPGAPEVV